jgi:hypothetical protein
MMDVFEHVDDYLGFLKLCKGRAKNTMFHIPLDISAQAVLRNQLIDSRNSVGHLHHFIKDTAIATLVDSGYEIVDYLEQKWLLSQESWHLVQIRTWQ